MTRAATNEPTRTARRPAAVPTSTAGPARAEVRDLDLSVVLFDRRTQMRVGGLDETTVEEYREAMLEGAVFPAGRAFFDGTTYRASRGWHRVEAARRAGLSTFRFEVLPGGLREAILDAAGSNARHGLRRTDADKRRAVETLLRDEEWGRWSDA